MPTETEQLRLEVQRLSALVAALAEKNLRLEEALGGAGRPPLPLATATGIPANPDIPPAAATGISVNPDIPEHTAIGIPVHRAIPEHLATGMPLPLSHPGTPVSGLPTGARSPSQPAAAAAGGPLPELFQRRVQTAQQEAALFTRLQQLAALQLDFGAVAQALKAGPLPRLRYPQGYSLARLLCWLARPELPANPYPELGRLLGFTNSGVYKLLQAAVRSGLVAKPRWQRYVLSEAGMQFLEKTGAPK